jgi:hypothetical protein
MHKNSHHNEISLLWNYLTNPETESAKRKYAYPLFMKIYGDKFKTESAASGADGYVEGQLLIELKTAKEDWLPGVFQALHYDKLEPKFSAICVMAEGFLGLWKIKNIPSPVLKLAKSSSPFDPPNDVGKKNAKIYKKDKRAVTELLNTATFLFNAKDVNSLFDKSYSIELYAFSQQLKSLDKERLQIRSTNFINYIQMMFKFFEDEIEAIHAFYSLVGYWDITSKVLTPRESEPELVNIIDKYNRQSEYVRVKQSKQPEFKKFIEDHYVHYNDGTGFPVDYYFSRFDEVIAQLKPEYAKQHGIFFTDYHLCKFTRWFIHNFYENKLHEKYIIFDPAGGSGNLVTSWRGHIQHKIISELQPDLLKTIEKRMLLDEDERGSFTIIPKTRTGEGLNFLNKDAADYLRLVSNELNEKNIQIDRPFAFFLNPPYKNTDENEVVREDNEAAYDIHPSIIELAGNDASRERYLAFLGQILNICRIQVEQHNNFEPLLMIFTPTSWLIPRPTFASFREVFDKHFEYQDGFVITGNEFFKISGKWPLAFTIWKYNYDENRKNKIKVRDYTNLKFDNIKNITFEDSLESVKNLINPFIKNTKTIALNNERGYIKDWVNQKMYDFKRDATKEELKSGEVFGGLPLTDRRRKNKKTYGVSNSTFIGFMDDGTPCRIKNDSESRHSNKPDRVWLQLRPGFIDVNLTKVQSGAPDKYGYCAFDLDSAKKTFSWFAITKAINGRYPIWANQNDLWIPNILPQMADSWHSLCFAFVLAENRCVVTKFEKDNPIPEVPEVSIDNPLCPINKNSFWSSVLDSEVKEFNAERLVKAINEFYKYWDKNFTKGSVLLDDCLKNEAYFKYFSYEPFLTSFSGIVQIKKYAQEHMNVELLNRLDEIDVMKSAVKEKIYELLTSQFKYFE